MARLTHKDRMRIRTLLDTNCSLSDIAAQVKCNTQTIYDEVKRGGGTRAGRWQEYDPEKAQCYAEKNRKESGKNLPAKDPIFNDEALAQYISELILQEGLNVQQVIRCLEENPPSRFARLPKSRNTIFAAIDAGLIPGVTRETLQTKTVQIYCNDIIHIPQWVIRRLSLQNGDCFSIDVTENTIVLTKAEKE